MPPSTDPVLRWGRAGVLALVALVTGAAAHTSADGLLPGWPVLALLFALTTATCRPLLARPASTSRVVGLAVAAQVAIHVALSATAGHRGDTDTSVVPLPPVTLGRPEGAAGPVPTSHAAPSLAESLHHLVADLPMMALHLVAAAVVGLWLARGERALWTALGLVWRFVSQPVAAVVPTRGPAVVRRPAPPAPPRLRLLAAAVSRRGPPPLRTA